MEKQELLTNGFREIGIDIDSEKLNKLDILKNELIEWNEKINLTTITEENEVYIKHFIDSATCISTGYIKQGARVIDVGTGAGFPGVPVKILRDDINITLMDSLNKRINYLNDVIQKLGLKNVDTVHSRAEEGGANTKYREKYDIALSRAVAAMNVLCEYCLPFVKVGGYFICQKGPKYEEDLKDAERAIMLLGGKIKEVKEYKLPYSDITHYIIIIEKIAETPTKYPRKPGKPTSDPLV